MYCIQVMGGHYLCQGVMDNRGEELFHVFVPPHPTATFLQKFHTLCMEVSFMTPPHTRVVQFYDPLPICQDRILKKNQIRNLICVLCPYWFSTTYAQDTHLDSQKMYGSINICGPPSPQISRYIFHVELCSRGKH